MTTHEVHSQVVLDVPNQWVGFCQTCLWEGPLRATTKESDKDVKQHKKEAK